MALAKRRCTMISRTHTQPTSITTDHTASYIEEQWDLGRTGISANWRRKVSVDRRSQAIVHVTRQSGISFQIVFTKEESVFR